MKTKIRAALLGIAFIMALTLASAATVSHVAAKSLESELSCFSQGAENRYVLRDYEGYVAVFVENRPDCPMTVTNIQVSTLRELDKRLLQTGMKVQSHERLVMTLEDLGS
ncbi:MAG: hypothetical protein GX025_00815 [Clostridiales bacterium]|nr:hypothetical protein [Clostridiales bacterium]